MLNILYEIWNIIFFLLLRSFHSPILLCVSRRFSFKLPHKCQQWVHSYWLKYTLFLCYLWKKAEKTLLILYLLNSIYFLLQYKDTDRFELLPILTMMRILCSNETFKFQLGLIHRQTYFNEMVLRVFEVNELNVCDIIIYPSLCGIVT